MKLSRELKTGIVAIGIITLLFWGFNFLKGENVFKGSATTYLSRYDNVQGLNTASIVTINGLQVGKVVDIRFDNDASKKGQLIVEFSVEKDFDFSKNSTAKIYSGSIMGGKSLAIVPSYEGAKAVPGDFLKGEVESDIFATVTESLNPLQSKIESVIVHTDSLMYGLNNILDDKSRRNIKYSIAQLSNITSNFSKASTSLNSLLDENQAKLTATFTNAEKMTANFSEMSDSLSKIDLQQTIAKLEGTLTQFNGMIAQMKDGNGTIGKLLSDDTMYTNLTNASKEMEELLREMKLHPKRFVHFSLFGKKDKGYKTEENKK